MGTVTPGSLYGTLELLIMKTLSDGKSRHGLAIAKEIGLISRDVLQIEEGALYPALRRLHSRGLITDEWRISEKRRRARFYTLTPKGKKAMQDELGQWITHTSAVLQILDVAWSDLQ